MSLPLNLVSQEPRSPKKIGGTYQLLRIGKKCFIFPVFHCSAKIFAKLCFSFTKSVELVGHCYMGLIKGRKKETSVHREFRYKVIPCTLLCNKNKETWTLDIQN